MRERNEERKHSVTRGKVTDLMRGKKGGRERRR